MKIQAQGPLVVRRKCSMAISGERRSRCLCLEGVDGTPNRYADALRHLGKIDHIVSQEDEDRTFFGIGLPPTAKCSGPTDRSHAGLSKARDSRTDLGRSNP